MPHICAGDCDRLQCHFGVCEVASWPLLLRRCVSCLKPDEAPHVGGEIGEPDFHDRCTPLGQKITFTSAEFSEIAFACHTTFPTCRAHYPGGSNGCTCRLLPRSCSLPQMAGGSASG